jgi:hypothetical protein
MLELGTSEESLTESGLSKVHSLNFIQQVLEFGVIHVGAQTQILDFEHFETRRDRRDGFTRLPGTGPTEISR